MLHNFDIRGKPLRLWQNQGESYQHVLMKALAFAMYSPRFPHLQVEVKVGLRYKPDLIAIDADGGFDFWGECGINSIRKTHWILKHTPTAEMVLFKIDYGNEQLAKQLREEIGPKYRPDGRLRLINFVSGIADLTASKRIAKVSSDWYSEIVI